MSDMSLSNKIFKGTVVVVLVGVIAKFAAFIEEAVMAAYLGTTYQSDAYYMVWSIHGVVYPMMSVGIWKVFLPLYKRHVAKEEIDIAYALTNKSLSFFTTISLFVVVLLIFFAPTAVSIVAPGFIGNTRILCIKLVRISAPMYIFIIASAVYASVLQSHERFLGSQIREVASHIPTILSAIFFYRMYGVEAMAFALVIAGILRLVIEIPFVNWGYRFKPDFKFNTQEFILMLKRFPSALVSAGVAQLNTLIDKAIASMLPAGSISGLNYGHKLTNVFSGLLSSAIATAMYPQMIEMIAQNKNDELGKLITKIINVFCVLMFPVTLACVLFRAELVSAVFQRGAFNENSTLLTADVFALYCLCLFTGACNTIISNVFYGNGDTKTPMYISLANLGINIMMNLILVRIWGVNGLALATSLSSISTFFIRLATVRRYVSLEKKILIITGIKVLIASVVSCMMPRIISWIFPLNKYLTLLISAVIGVNVYLLMVKILKVTEIDDLISMLRRRMDKDC